MSESINQRYNHLKEKVIERKKDTLAFTEFLETRTSWITSPASTRFHLNIEGGLMLHSVSVAENLLKFRDFLAPKISEESCVIVGLFHDVGKVGMPNNPLYLKNNNEWEIRNRNMTYNTNPNLPFMSLAARSLYLISQYIQLSDTEAQAILYHDGQYIDDNVCVRHKEEPLTLLAHWADYWTAHIYEEERSLE